MTGIETTDINSAGLPPPMALRAAAIDEDASPPTGHERPSLIMQALHGLDALIAAQGAWLKSWHVEVLGKDGAREPCAASPLRPDVGQWMQALHHVVLVGHPASADAVDLLHTLQHEADALVETVGREGRMPAKSYDQFMNVVLAFSAKVRELQNDTWNRLAHVDPLTGLGNRQAMWRRLHAECERHARIHHPCCLVMIDLDNFKPINDTYGHASGDIVLANVAALLAASVRPYDSVFRFGGDEFLLCLPNTDTRAAWAIVERLRLKLANQHVTIRPGIEARTTLSVGVAPLTAVDGVEICLEHADAALYTAKRRGRNCVYVWSHSDH